LAKPFSIQAPEDIAKEYAGNKQMIAQAAQMGVIDPTAAVLAGMFIDRMRSAQVMEAAQMPSVAQQVLGAPQPAAPAPAGLGATPQAAAMPPMGVAPQMGMPPQEMAPPQMEMPAEEMPMMADGGMVPPYASGGGLSDVPVPDGMFDEPSNGGFGDGYAGGGMVAFAPGGDVDAARLRRALLMQESGGDYGITNAEGSGAMGAYQFMPPTARALAKRLGLEYRPDLMSGDKGRSKEGRAYQERLMDAQMEDILAYSGGDIGKAGAYHFAGPNTKGHGAKTRKYEQDILRRYSGSKDTGEIPERDINTAQGQVEGVEDIFGTLMSRFGPSEKEREIDAMRMARAEEMASPEYYEKQRKDSMWETLASVGFNMASSKAPTLLQAIGEAASAALPGAQADKKERKALKDRSLDLMVQLGAKDRKEALPLYNMAVEMKKNDIAQKNFNTEIDIKKAQLAIQSAEVDNQLAKIIADSQGKENTKERFVETFYNKLKREGYSENAARQWAYIIAEKKLAEIKGTSENLFGEQETGGATGQKSADVYDYEKDLK
jgi:hypothetical protein